MTTYKDCTEPRTYCKELRKLFSEPQIIKALASTGRIFRKRLVPAPLAMLVFISSFVQGASGLRLVLGWLRFGKSDANISEAAIYKARQRIGRGPFEWLRQNVIDWLAKARTDPTAFYRGHRLIAADGTTLTVADTKANEQHFGRARNKHKSSGFPLFRLMVLCEIGTRAIVRWATCPFNISEVQLLWQLLGQVPAGSLLLADRNFHSWSLWEHAKNAGLSMLLRVQAGPKFPVRERLADGSYLSEIFPSKKHPDYHNRKKEGIRVRVIDCQIRIGSGISTYRLVTNLLDPKKAPARELVDVYAKRWEVEIAFKEFKGQLKPRTTPLRSHHPETVLAELDALLIGYYVVRRIALGAARQEKVDPLSISFCQVVKAITYVVLRPRMSRREFYQVVSRMKNKRRKRQCRRCRKTTRSAWPAKQPGEHSFTYKKAKIHILDPGLS
jgi:hypothetical protein